MNNNIIVLNHSLLPSLRRSKCNQTRTFGEYCVSFSTRVLALLNFPMQHQVKLDIIPPILPTSLSVSSLLLLQVKSHILSLICQRLCVALLDTNILAPTLPWPLNTLRLIPSHTILVIPSTVFAGVWCSQSLIFGTSASFVSGFDVTYVAGREVVSVGLFEIWVRRWFVALVFPKLGIVSKWQS